ncbi:MAG: hypothetical protein Q9157_003453 [Trypethelium eluteriae]
MLEQSTSTNIAALQRGLEDSIRVNEENDTNRKTISTSVASLSSIQQTIFESISQLADDVSGMRVQQSLELSTVVKGVQDIDRHLRSLHEVVRLSIANTGHATSSKMLAPAIDQLLSQHRKKLHNRFRISFSEQITYYSESRNIFGHIFMSTRLLKRAITEGDHVIEQLETRSSFAFHPASWLISLGMKIAVQIKYQGLLPTITTTRAVSDDALIFEFCHTGNVDGVRTLF